MAVPWDTTLYTSLLCAYILFILWYLVCVCVGDLITDLLDLWFSDLFISEGNVQSFEMPSCLSYNLIPTVCDEKAILGMVKARRNMTTNSDELYGQAIGDGPISK